MKKDFKVTIASGPVSEWVSVPLFPTMEMLKAAGHACDGLDLSEFSKADRSILKAAKRWEAMLAASPKLLRDPQTLPQSKKEWNGPYVSPNGSGELPSHEPQDYRSSTKEK